ncbi:MAG: hypothetical protein JSS32_03480 [Verrucomicrobia bacterium]|nr:hypothetical protein [Verrucomicrobiota bacterium]
MSCKVGTWPRLYKRASAILALYAIGIYFFALRNQEGDSASYKKLVDESVDLRSKHALEREPAIQHRTGVQKEIWTVEGAERPHIKIVSKKSELTLRQNRGKFTGDETLFSIDLQHAGYKLEAEQAKYDGARLALDGAFHMTHPIGELRAQSALLNGLNLKHDASELQLGRGVRIDLPPSESLNESLSIVSDSAFCTLLPETPFTLLKFEEIQFKKNVVIESGRGIKAQGGIAIYKNRQISLYPELPLLHCRLTHDRFDLEAETIQLQLDGDEKPTLAHIATTGDSLIHFPPAGRLSCKGAIHYDPVSQILSASPKTPLQFSDETLAMEADKAQIDMGSELLTLEGNIRFISSHFQGKETYAIAEKASYFPKENRLVLNSSSARKVLFWQNGFTLTAPEVHIQRDTETVQGVGDVHFSFDLDEQNYFDEIFSRYL